MNLQGSRGATGAQGSKGDRGETGPRRATGAQGSKGDTGATGPRGATGAQAPKGEQGETGSQILSSTASPTAAVGRNGDYYFHTTTGALFGSKTKSGWGAGIILRGVQGPKGDKCEIGDTGARGAQGERGPKGDKGDPGTANVIYSEWIRADWDFQNARSRSLTINGLQALQNPEKSSVRLYMRFGVQQANYALPYTEFWNDGNVTTDYTFGQNYINARIIGTGMNIDPFQYNEIYFRYIIIPGGVAAAAQINGIDLNNLEAISQAFHIPLH